MIKFWKSAAKGKSGCPVRPPEQSHNVSEGHALEKLIENEDLSGIFIKRSRLSPTLVEVITNKNIVKYFIQYLETVGMLVIIKCWLELENFRIIFKNSVSNNNGNHTKINRTKSFDVGNEFGDSKNNMELTRRHSCKMRNEEYNQINATLDNKVLNNAYHQKVPCNCHDKTCNDCANENSANVTDEAIKLFKKYIALEAPNKLDIPDNIRKCVISNICKPEGHLDEDCFKPVQDVIFHQMELHFEGFQKNVLYIKAQIDILTNGSLALGDILYNDSILFYFTEYMEQESCSVLLEFLIVIMHFRDNMNSSTTLSPEQEQDDAIVLYQKYFSLQATSPIGFSTDVRLNVEGEICREGGPLYNCFDLPYQIVYKTVEKYVKNFLESDIYFKYLSEMINSVDHNWQSHKKTNSDCSSEVSISTQNTLLAMGDPIFRLKKCNHSVPDMTIDANQLYNADSLWQRKRQDGLNLGRINSLGRFESKFEPDPDKKEKSVLKKMINRFVPNSSQVEEEMAWQIAHMIVKDITDLTMAPPDNVS